jgi:SAM-dependent methyltransferase
MVITILDMGCGNRKTKGAIGLDISKDSEADIIHNLDNVPYPFKDGIFDVITSNHSIEHLRFYYDKGLIEGGWNKLLSESKRLLKDDGKLVIKVPHFSSVNAYGKVDHHSLWSIEKLKEACNKYGFRPVKIRLSYTQNPDNESIKRVINSLLNPFFNVNHHLTERVFTYWFGGISELYGEFKKKII